MKLSIFGLGYVGAVSMACLARDGHEVIGVDIDPGKLALIRAGKSPIIEEGMQELMEEVVASGCVEVTASCDEAIRASALSFVCVGTPARANGSQDQSAIQRVAEDIGAALAAKDDYHVIVIRSTVQPGTVEGALLGLLEEHSGKVAGRDFDVCFQPEFLREGSSIRDYDNPPFTVVGAGSERAFGVLEELFGHLPNDFVRTSIGTAEWLKYACNAFHAVKVTFANEIGRVVQSLGGDSHAVMDLVCRDTVLNISRAYLRPGFAYGGSCLPKDLNAVLHLAKTRDVTLPMLKGVPASNRVHIDHAIDMVLAGGRRRVAMVGLSFKSGTDDLRESPLVTMVERFIGKGVELGIYDREVSVARLTGANRRYIEETIPHIASLMREDLPALIEASDVVVVGLQDEHVRRALAESTRDDQYILDLVGIADRESLRGQYQGVCW